MGILLSNNKEKTESRYFSLLFN